MRRQVKARVRNLPTFWEEYEAGRRRASQSEKFKSQSRTGRRELLKIDDHNFGVVREFPNFQQMDLYLFKNRRINDVGERIEFEHLHFQLTHIIGIDFKKNRLLEQVYEAPNADVLMGSQDKIVERSIFGEAFLKKMKEKGVSLEELREPLSKAYQEIEKKLVYQAASFDFAWTNMIVLDYDKETKKPLIAVTDYLESH